MNVQTAKEEIAKLSKSISIAEMNKNILIGTKIDAMNSGSIDFFGVELQFDDIDNECLNSVRCSFTHALQRNIDDWTAQIQEIKDLMRVPTVSTIGELVEFLQLLDQDDKILNAFILERDIVKHVESGIKYNADDIPLTDELIDGVFKKLENGVKHNDDTRISVINTHIFDVFCGLVE